MLHKVPTIRALVQQLQQVPYLASKNLYRVLSHFLDMDDKKLNEFCNSLKELKEKVSLCQICFCWFEKSRECLFCSDQKRDQSIVCVVEQWQDVLSIENTNGYEGVYHVLRGVIYPLEGVGPEDLTINALITRIEAHSEIKELILATSQTPEGEATASYIAQKCKSKDITLSCLARGLPVGSSLGATDRLTVFKALCERRPF